MGKFLAFVLSPFKWIKCICHLIYLDIIYSEKLGGHYPIIDSLRLISICISETIEERKKFDFDFFYNKLKKRYIEVIKKPIIPLFRF